MGDGVRGKAIHTLLVLFIFSGCLGWCVQKAAWKGKWWLIQGSPRLCQPV